MSSARRGRVHSVRMRCRLQAAQRGDRARHEWKPLQCSTHPRSQRADDTPMYCLCALDGACRAR